MINKITENKMCSPDSDEDVEKLHNKDTLNEVCHLSSIICLLFLYLILDFSDIVSYLFMFTQVAEIQDSCLCGLPQPQS